MFRKVTAMLIINTLFIAVAIILTLTQALSAQTTQPAAQVRADIPYLPPGADDHARTTCRLDLHLPAQPATNFPLLVWFHGGGLIAGSRDTERAMVERFVAHGIAVANVDYRLAPQVKFPVYIEDAARAVAWATTAGVEAGADPRRIFVSGHSAGGYLTAMLAMDPQYLQAAGVKPDAVAGYIPVSGQMLTHAQVRAERGLSPTSLIADAASPLYHLRADAPPLLLLVGDDDLAARLEENRLFAAALSGLAQNKTVACHIIPDRNHDTIVQHLLTPSDPAGQLMLKFITAP